MGVAPAIRRLAGETPRHHPRHLLHCPDDELRNTLVPANNRWPLADVMDAAKYYAERTGRRISIEYALIRDVNDQLWRADMLGQLLHRELQQMAHVNLIPLKPHPASGTPPAAASRGFPGTMCAPKGSPARCVTPAGGTLPQPVVSSRRRREVD